MVGVLLEESSCFEADGAEHRALVSLAQVGLVPELRHISAAAAG
ncbi:MAG TPA: hypothetical protein VHC41_07725 [Mycobacteriales bacterium]|nr:hypothetical protein [Mycobacteriales bacterium]